MEVVVKKWGNSAAVRIPASVLADSGIELEQAVEIREDRGRIVIEASRRKSFALGELVKRIRPDNLHEPIDTGAAVGREVW
jgi:antitoxin MazE